jgi:hypothetical protein
VKKEKIKKIWPLFPAADPLGDDIRKFEHIGTHPEYLELAVGEALAFHHGIGTFTVDDMDMARLQQVLFEKHNIYTIVVSIPEDVKGIRVTPSIYTTLRELDLFLEAASHYIKSGLPA